MDSVILHCNYFSLGNESTFDTNSCYGFSRCFLEQACIICVNEFILISGWFGIKFSYKGIYTLLFQSIYFSVFLIFIGIVFGLNIPVGESVRSLYFGSTYWFIPCYLLLYVLSPILNKYIELSNEYELRKMIGALLVFEFLLGNYIDVSGFAGGYSTLSFVVLYLIARYLRLCHIERINSYTKITYLLLYVIFTFIPVLIVEVFGSNSILSCTHLSYNNPFVITASIFFFLFFKKLHFSSKTINVLGASSFTVYLLQLHPITGPYFKEYMFSMYKEHLGYNYIIISFLISLLLLILGFILDQPRKYIGNCIYNFVIKLRR